jgi:hypothetical protein
LGCPARYSQRSVAELAEHFEDLTHAGIENGLDSGIARARATEELGDPMILAERLVASFRQASWWGRHPIIGFCLLPPLALMVVLPVTVLGLYGLFLLGNLFSRHSIPLDEFKSAVVTAPAAFAQWNNPLLCLIHSLPIAINTILFCKLVVRSASGTQWLIVTCAVGSASGFFTWTGFSTSGFYLGYGAPSLHNWISAIIPFLIATGIFIWRKRRLALIGAPHFAEVPPLERENDLQCADAGRRSNIRRASLLLDETWFTPTSAVAAAVVVISVVLIKFVFTHDKADHVRIEELRSRVWPDERKRALDFLQIRQSVQETSWAKSVSLRPFATAALSDPLCWFGRTNFATLADLPRGLHRFAGIPFAISERVQLMGNGYKDLGMAFPSVIKGIPIDQKCRFLYLLHGACFVRTKAPSVPDEHGFTPVLPLYESTNIPVARLLLHYADQQQATIEIFSTQHLLDVWGPICTSEVPVRERCVSSPASELAWTSRQVPEEKSEMPNSVRVYKSRFENPRPDSQVVALDYASTRTDAAPFLLGLTIE